MIKSRLRKQADFVRERLVLKGKESVLSLINRLSKAEHYTVEKNVSYGASSRNVLDIYMPKDLKRKAPVIVFFHGGNWSEGFPGKGGYLFIGEALTAHGFVVMLANYRRYPQVKFPEIMKDSAAAVAWAYEHLADYGGDPKKFFVMGFSAGAHISAMLTLNPRYLQKANCSRDSIAGTIGLAGPYDFLPITKEYQKELFGPEEKYPLSQPINFIDGNAPPMLLLHGKEDATVRVRNTISLAEKIEEKGGRVEAHYYEKLGHRSLIGSLARPFRYFIPVLDDVAKFVEES